MRTSIVIFAVFTALVGTTYLFRTEISPVVSRVYTRLVPCSEPISYRLGPVDSRFGMSEQEFLKAIKEAELIWEGRTGKNLFSYDEKYGNVVVSLEYDYRQEAVDRLKGLGISITKSRSTYDSLKDRFDSMSADVAKRKKSLETRTNEFQHAQDLYNAQVEMWNGRGGAPQDLYVQIQSEKNRLLVQAQQIQADERVLNSDIDTINALGTTLNRLANELNVEVAKYNAIGSGAGEDFEEGLYESTVSGESIHIYEFEDHSELVRVLAHELGHALGLDHVDDPQAIMYPVNQSTNTHTTPADIVELRRICSVD